MPSDSNRRRQTASRDRRSFAAAQPDNVADEILYFPFNFSGRPFDHRESDADTMRVGGPIQSISHLGTAVSC